MNSSQSAAFLAAAGTDHAYLSAFAISLLAAVAVLWGANVIRKLGMQALHDDLRQKEFVVYAVRAMILVMVVIYLCS